MGNQPPVFLVLNLMTALYDEAKEDGNHREFCKFLDRTQGGPVPGTLSGVVAHELTLDGKPLACTNEDVKLA